MAEAYQCDSCRSFHEDKPVMRVTFEPIAGTSGTRKFDLCPQCLSRSLGDLDNPPTSTPAPSRVDSGVRGFGRSRSAE